MFSSQVTNLEMNFYFKGFLPACLFLFFSKEFIKEKLSGLMVIAFIAKRFPVNSQQKANIKKRPVFDG